MTSPETSRAEGLSPSERLANRATLLTFLGLCSLLLALLAMPLTFRHTERTVARAVASSPLAVGLGAGLLARSARAQLRAQRQAEAGQGTADAGGAAGVPSSPPPGA